MMWLVALGRALGEDAGKGPNPWAALMGPDDFRDLICNRNRSMEWNLVSPSNRPVGPVYGQGINHIPTYSLSGWFQCCTSARCGGISPSPAKGNTLRRITFVRFLADLPSEMATEVRKDICLSPEAYIRRRTNDLLGQSSFAWWGQFWERISVLEVDDNL